MVLDRFIRVQIYNATETAVEYDNTVEGINWGISDASIRIVNSIVDKDLKFGELNSGEFSIQLFGLNVDLTGRKIKVSCIETVDESDVLAVDDTEDLEVNESHDLLSVSTNQVARTIGLFTGWIDSCKMDNSGTYRDLVAYDWLYWHREDDVLTWWESIWPTGTTSRTLGYIRNSLLTYLDVEFHDITSPLDSTTFENVFNGMTSIKLNIILPMLLEITSTCVYVDGNGDLQLTQLSATTTYNITDNIEGENSTWENYTTKAITGVGIYDSSSELAQLYGTKDNVYNISGNIFLLSKTASELNTICAGILNAIQNITYTPAQLKLIVSDLTYGLGKKVHTEKGDTYIFRRTLSGSFLVDEEIQAQATKDTITEIVDSYNDSFVNSYKIASLKKDIDEFSVDYADFKEDTEAKFAVTYNKIVLHVKSNGHLASAQLNADPSGVADFKIQADNIDFIANDSIQLTSKSLGIYSTNFQVTPEGNVTCNNLTANTSGTIGGWTIAQDGLSYVDSVYVNQNIKLSSTGMYIELCDGIREIKMSSGQIEFHFNEQGSSQSVGYIRNSIYTYTTNNNGIYIGLDSAGTFISLNNRLVINEGQYGSSSEHILLFGSLRCYWPAYFTNPIYLSQYNTSTGQYTDDDYLDQGRQVIANTTYQGVRVARNLFTDGKVFASSHIYTEGISVCVNHDAIIGTTSNNYVTDNNSYKGLRIYDRNANFYYGEHFTAADMDGTIRSYMFARNIKTDGAEVYNQLGCGVKKDGTQYYYMTSPSAFRQAISVDGIGETTDNDYPSAQTCPNSTWKSVASIASLPAGKYLLFGTVNFDANSNGNRHADISTGVNGTPISRHAYTASKNASGRTVLQMVVPINITSATTYYLNAYQDSGGNISATGQLTAIKIRG